MYDYIVKLVMKPLEIIADRIMQTGSQCRWISNLIVQCAELYSEQCDALL